MRNIIIISTLICCLFTWCKSSKKCEKLGIINIDQQYISYNYCDCIEDAIENKDLPSFKKIILMDVDGNGYNHGSVIIFIIDELGEDNLIKFLKEFNEKEVIKFYSNIAPGFDDTNDEKYKGKNIRKAFPKIAKFLCETQTSNYVREYTCD